MFAGDLGVAFRRLDQRLLRVCELEEDRADRMASTERGWAALRAALRPEVPDLLFDVDDDAAPLWPAHGPPAIVRARHVLGLDAIEADILLVLLAPHVEPRYLRVLTALQDEPGRQVVERGLFLVLGRTPARAAVVARALGESGTLRRAGLITVGAGDHPPRARPLDLAADVRDALLDLPAPSVLDGARLTWSAAGGPAPRGLAAVVHGPGERRTTACTLAAGARTVEVRGTHDAAAIRSAWRTAALRGAVPLVELAHLEPSLASALAAPLVDDVATLGGAAIVLAREPLATVVAHHVAPAPSFRERRDAWLAEATAAAVTLGADDLHRLAVNLRLDREEIREVLAAVGSSDADAIMAAARRISGASVRHGDVHETTRTFDDMVLRDTTRMALERLIHFTTHRDRVAEERGIEGRFRLRRGPIVLFSGRSGTGKTLAAEVIAGALRRPLHVIDLSRLVSKYIGETEKHIDEVLRMGERAGAVLFFDEADSLFASRTEVTSSNDRYANLEVGYLLQRIEHHDGLVILATNLQQTIDEAFLRRFHARIEFPFPEATERKQLWELMLPGALARGDDLDLAALAAQHVLAGGDIRNAALKAIFLAEQDGTAVAQQHLERAIAIELHELGRLSRRDTSERDTGQILRLLVHALERAIDADVRRRFWKEIHIINGSPTKETLAGKRPAISLAIHRLAAASDRALRLGMIISAWSSRAEEELELLGALVELLATLHVPELDGRTCTLRLQQSHDFDLLHRFWSSHGHPVRASIVLDIEVSGA